MPVFDNVGNCRYEVPDYWTIGEVYERLIEDMAKNSDKNIIDWTIEEIENNNTKF